MQRITLVTLTTEREGKMRRIIGCLMVSSLVLVNSAIAGHIPPASSISDMVIFYEVAGNPPHIGPAAPTDAKSLDEVMQKVQKDFSPDKAMVWGIVGLEGAEGHLVTTLMVMTKDGNGVKGWNVVIRQGKTERTYISIENKKQAVMAQSVGMYVLLAQIDMTAVDPSLSADTLDAKVKPYLEYLQK